MSEISLDSCFAAALGLSTRVSAPALAEHVARAGRLSLPTSPAAVAVLCEVAIRTQRFVEGRAARWIMLSDCPSAVIQQWERTSRHDDEWQSAEGELSYLNDPGAGAWPLSDTLFAAVFEVARRLADHGCLKDVSARERVRRGDRFRLFRDAEVRATYIYYAPAHTVGGPAVLPEGTVIVAFDQVDGSVEFGGYPEAYDELEDTVVPAHERASAGYAGGYAVSFNVNDIDDLLEPIEPLHRRPERSRLPRLRRLGGPDWPQN
jgi:hypothetical protein